MVILRAVIFAMTVDATGSASAMGRGAMGHTASGRSSRCEFWLGNSSGMGNPPGFGSPGFPGRVTGQSLTTRGVPVPIPVPVPILVDVDMLRAPHYVVCIALLYP